jgi:biopolymer transport protein ExbB
MTFRYAIWAVFVTVVFCGPVLAQEEPSQMTSINYFQRFVIDGGMITWLVLIPLSIATLALILEHALSIRTTRLLGQDQYDQLAGTIDRGDMVAAWKFSAEQSNFLFAVVKRGLAELANSYESAEYAIIEAAEEQATKLLRKIEYLNIIGNVAPMIGLFGTVYGIILAFNEQVEIARRGGVAKADQLAEGISIALVTTFWGLIVAIPALAMYGLFRNRIDAVAAQVANLSLDLIRKVKPEARSALKDIVNKSSH